MVGLSGSSAVGSCSAGEGARSSQEPTGLAGWLLEPPGGTPRHCSRCKRGAAAVGLNQGANLILLVRGPILGIANADDDVGCAEPEVRVVSDVVNAHVFLFSDQLGHRMGGREPQGPTPGPQSSPRGKRRTLTSTSSPLGRSLNHFTKQVRPTWSPDCTTP